jgi:hypothetical protein
MVLFTIIVLACLVIGIMHAMHKSKEDRINSNRKRRMKKKRRKGQASEDYEDSPHMRR